MTVFFNWICKVSNNVLIVGIILNVRKVFGHRFAGHRHAMSVQQTRVQESFHQRLNATNRNELGHQVLTARAQVGQNRDFGADSREIVELQRHPGLESHGEQMQHCIRRTAQRDDDGNRVLKRLAG